MKFLIINGKIQTLGGKPIVVPDDYDNNLIKIGGKLVKTGTSLIGSKHSGGSGGGSTVAASAIFNDDANGNADGIEGDVFLTWEELKDPANGELYMYEASAISDTEIGDAAFGATPNLISITIPDGVTSIGRAAFFGTGLTNIEIPDSVTSIGDEAFQTCVSLTNIIIPDGVTSIGATAFAGCESLTNITIPNTITYIGDQVFEASPNLTDITFTGTLAQWKVIIESYGIGRLIDTTIHCTDRCADLFGDEIDCPMHGTNGTTNI